LTTIVFSPFRTTIGKDRRFVKGSVIGAESLDLDDTEWDKIDSPYDYMISVIMRIQ
jgi:hypothetical protein